MKRSTMLDALALAGVVAIGVGVYTLANWAAAAVVVGAIVVAFATLATLRG